VLFHFPDLEGLEIAILARHPFPVEDRCLVVGADVIHEGLLIVGREGAQNAFEDFRILLNLKFKLVSFK
jgi:hypothetical protein